jgi:excinuclease ABC subunit A
MAGLTPRSGSPAFTPQAESPSPALAREPARTITLRGVRTHNLKSIDLELPLGRLIAVTGISGAGKSSLAFDTLFAEGQRRYVETLSPYARQFLAKLDKPDAELIAGIPPAIAVRQLPGRQSSRSTIGTITEIHDLLGLLFARAGQVVCRSCGERIEPASPATIAQALEDLPAGTPYEIAFPVEVGARTDPTALSLYLRALGFTRLRVNGHAAGLDEADLALGDDARVAAIVDRLVRGKDPLQRRTDSLETALSHGIGRCRILTSQQSWTYVRGWRCGRCGTDHLEPEPNLFRYHTAAGACPVCEGLGRKMELDMARIVPDPSKTVRQGALAPWSAPGYRGFLEGLLAVADDLGLSVDVPFKRMSAQEVERLRSGVPGSGFGGLEGFFRGLERRSYKVQNRVFLSRWRREQVCPACQGSRLRSEALAVKVAGRDISEVSAMTIAEVRLFFQRLESLSRRAETAGVMGQIGNRLGYLSAIGVGYLTLDRSARSLSGGEMQRVALTKTLGSGLVNTLYVLDEPTAGLHHHEIGAMVAIIRRIRDLGNTLVVVEHDHDLIRATEHVVDLGPGAGVAGGEVLYSGPVADFSKAEGSATSEYLHRRKRIAVPAKRRPVSKRALRLIGARGNNLKTIDVTFPLGVLCVVTGVSGSGKSTLVEETLYPVLKQRIAGEPVLAAPHEELRGGSDIADAVFLDQSPLARSGRSNPATHCKVFDEIRKTFAATHEAKLRKYDAGRFSFNVEGGRCSACQGNGFLTIDMQFLPDVIFRCPECLGTRYRPEILEITYRGRNIAEVLELTVREAFLFFRNRPRIQARLRSLLDIGLDYLKLGQPVSTLSGGEAQRLKLAGFLAQSLAALKRPGAGPHTIFLLEEPTAGLHPADVVKLLEVLNALLDRGGSLVIIEHSLEVMVSADWIIDLGPGAGEEGGRVVAQGTPEEVAKVESPTGRALAQALGQLNESRGDGRSAPPAKSLTRERGRRAGRGRAASRQRPGDLEPES